MIHDVIKPTDLYMRVLGCHPQVRQRLPSRMRRQIRATLTDQPYTKGLGKLILEGVKSKQPEELLFNFDVSDAIKHLNEVIVELGYDGYDQHGMTCTYQIRHGSASTDG